MLRLFQLISVVIILIKPAFRTYVEVRAGSTYNLCSDISLLDMHDNNLYVYTAPRNKVATIGAQTVSVASKTEFIAIASSSECSAITKLAISADLAICCSAY